jgi:hypothetical protein
MAEYCSMCSPFDGEYDYDLYKQALSLETGRSTSFLCEGCNIRGVYKDEMRLIYLARMVDGEVLLKLVNIEDLIPKLLKS